MIQLRRGSTSDWASVKNTEAGQLKSGQPGIEFNNDNGLPFIKIGTGLQDFSELQYLGASELYNTIISCTTSATTKHYAKVAEFVFPSSVSGTTGWAALSLKITGFGALSGKYGILNVYHTSGTGATTGGVWESCSDTMTTTDFELYAYDTGHAFAVWCNFTSVIGGYRISILTNGSNQTGSRWVLSSYTGAGETAATWASHTVVGTGLPFSKPNTTTRIEKLEARLQWTVV